MWNNGVNINSLSLCSHYLKMIFEETDQVLATGTGFIYEYNNYYYLITNGHNVTGVNPETGNRLAKHGGFPTIIRTSVKHFLTNPVGAITNQSFDIPLYENGVPIWLIHPKYGYKVDVIAIPICKINEVESPIKLFPINKHAFDDDFSPEVSDDAYVIGFPLNIVNFELPIWKRATIATEISIDLDDLPKILVDTATRSGMSGSPVIYQRTGYLVHPYDKQKNVIGQIRGFLGIYSGRIGVEDNFQSQLGIVWKKQVIDEILENNIQGTTEFQNCN